MPCQDCPEEPIEPIENEPGIPDVVLPAKKPSRGWVIYTGGPPEAHLSAMQHTLPADYKRARFLPDGSIQYEKGPDDWEPPSPIEGYECDAEDDRLFRPLWESCQRRLYSAGVKEGCKCIQIRTICSRLETESSEQVNIDFATCHECKWREPIPVRLSVARSRAPTPE